MADSAFIVGRWRRCARAVLGLSLLAASSFAPGQTAGTPAAPVQRICEINACFINEAAKRKYEEENNCKFVNGAVCGGKTYDKDTQCCGKNAKTGSDEIQNKQATALNGDFNWEAYRKQCPNMRQSEGAPDGLWAQCRVGQRHGAGDDYTVVEVQRPAGNPKARSYCIDGCSTPPGTVTLLYRTGYFIFRNKDNPTGGGPGGIGELASFFGACAAHDKCYQTCDTRDQKACDDELLANMLAVCNRIPPNHVTVFKNNLGFDDEENTQNKCREAADIMHTGLRLPIEASRAAFKMRRQQYCQCC